MVDPSRTIDKRSLAIDANAIEAVGISAFNHGGVDLDKRSPDTIENALIANAIDFSINSEVNMDKRDPATDADVGIDLDLD